MADAEHETVAHGARACSSNCQGHKFRSAVLRRSRESVEFVLNKCLGRSSRLRANDRGKTVTKPGLLSRLGLALSEKQIPQVVEIIESG
jgi:hypothetical protein